jgi:two-component system, sensor histidine kinase SagS
MSGEKPKIMVLGATDDVAERLRKAVGVDYDIVVAPPAPGSSSAAVAAAGTPRQDLADRLLRTVGEALCVADERGGMVWCNDVFQSLEGPVKARAFEAAREWHAARMPKSRLELGDACPLPRRLEVASTDESRWYEVEINAMAPGSDAGSAPAPGSDPGVSSTANSAAGVESSEPQLDLCGIVVRDVTTSKRFRQKVASIDRAGADLLRLDADEIRRMHPAERLKLAEAKITRHTREILNFDHFAIRLLDRKSGRLELVMSYGMPPEFGDIEIRASTTGNGTSGWVAATGKSYICTDASHDALFLPGLSGARSSLTVPLTLNDKVIGMMDIESQQLGAFDEEDRQFAEIFTRYVSLALHTLDLLVVERSATNENASRRVTDELAHPLADILEQTDALLNSGELSAQATSRLMRIREDVASIREEVRELAAGPQTILNVERELSESRTDPLIAGKRVLIADDEQKVRKIIGDIMKNRGAEVAVFENGGTAIKALEDAHAGLRPPFDLVLSDIKMPDKTGYDVFSSARRSRPDLPVILMTGFGYDPHHSIVRASQEGCKQVLFKPFEATTLLEEVRKALTAAAAAR